MFAKHWSEYVPVTYPAPAVPPVGGGGDVDRQGLEQELLQPAGLRQYQLDYMGAQWTALVSDMALVWDEAYRGHVEFYATNRCDVGKKRREMRHIYFETKCRFGFCPDKLRTEIRNSKISWACYVFAARYSRRTLLVPGSS